jgi:hypothetical protein
MPSFLHCTFTSKGRVSVTNAYIRLAQCCRLKLHLPPLSSSLTLQLTGNSITFFPRIRSCGNEWKYVLGGAPYDLTARPGALTQKVPQLRHGSSSLRIQKQIHRRENSRATAARQWASDCREWNRMCTRNTLQPRFTVGISFTVQLRCNSSELFHGARQSDLHGVTHRCGIEVWRH